MNYQKHSAPSQDWSHKKHTAAFSQKLYIKGGMQRNEVEETVAAVEKGEREQECWVGIG